MFQKNKIFIFLILLCFAVNAFSQTRQIPNKPDYDLAPYHFGFLLGINKMLFAIRTNPDYQKVLQYNTNDNLMPDQASDSAFLYNMETTPTFGFVIGIIGNLRMGNRFDLRFTPSLTFGERDIDYTIKNYFDTNPVEMLYVTKSIQSTFVEFPLWVHYKGERIHNIRPYIMAGAKYSLDLASNAKKKAQGKSATVFIDKKDIYAMGGFGFDFYTAYFKFGTEVSMSYGLFDILKKDNSIYTTSVDYMRSKIFQISFTFE